MTIKDWRKKRDIVVGKKILKETKESWATIAFVFGVGRQALWDRKKKLGDQYFVTLYQEFKNKSVKKLDKKN
jgi:hypothetical protein